MDNKKKLAYEFARNKKTFDSDFPYLEDLEFLGYLKDEYEKMEEYEICMIIEARIRIFSAKAITDEAIAELNRKIELYKIAKGRSN